MIHKTAIIDDNVSIGEGTNVWAYSHICSGATIGKNCVIGEGVYIGPNDFIPQVGGDWKNSDRFRTTLFKKGCSVGANCTIVCGITIGENSLIGAGSVVTKNVPSNAKTYGNPSKIQM